MPAPPAARTDLAPRAILAAAELPIEGGFAALAVGANRDAISAADTTGLGPGAGLALPARRVNQRMSATFTERFAKCPGAGKSCGRASNAASTSSMPRHRFLISGASIFATIG